MILTLVLLSIGLLLILVVGYNIVQQYKQKVETDRRITMSSKSTSLMKPTSYYLTPTACPIPRHWFCYYKTAFSMR